ncbi:MAG: hypothetical protein U9Q06_00705 [Nanoarchaeota archaeon]|nr:hypothetical protein [Nanoarchaeota archaeon]
MELRCKKCNFFFQGSGNSNLCPNCGEKNVLFEEKSAEELINEID